MKAIAKVIAISFLTIGILAACENGEEMMGDNPDVDGEAAKVDEQEKENENHGTESVSNGIEEGDSSVESGDVAGQLELNIGDTGRISSNTSDFEITVNSVELIDGEVDGEAPMFDYFLKAEVIITNLGESALSRENSIGILEMTDNLEASGTPDYSTRFESIDSLDADIPPGETVNVEVLFDIYGGEMQFIRVNPGLIASDAVQTDVSWTFSLEEARNE